MVGSHKLLNNLKTTETHDAYRTLSAQGHRDTYRGKFCTIGLILSSRYKLL